MAAGPCENPDCHSYGKAHPNCECYLRMAGGGEATFDPDAFLKEGQPAPAPAQPAFDPDAFLKANTKPAFDPDAFLNKPDYSTPLQQAATIAEGAAQGVPGVGPAVTAAELQLSKLGVPGTSAEDINARAAANPYEHDISKGATAIGSTLAATAGLSALGTAATNAALQGSDEATNYLLGNQDKNAPVASALAHIGAAGLFGGLVSKAGSLASGKLASIANENIGSKFAPWLEGAITAANGQPINALSEEANIADKIAGHNFYNSLTAGLIPHATGIVGATEGGIRGYQENGVPGAVTGAIKGGAEGALAGWVGKNVIGKISSTLGKNAVAPFLAKIASSGTMEGLGDAVNYATSVSQGLGKVNAAIDGLVGATATIPQQYVSDKEREFNRQQVKDYLDNGGIQQNINQTIENMNQANLEPQLYAGGGLVEHMPQPQTSQGEPFIKENDGMNIHFPEQNALLGSAKMRISNYLSNLKPNKTVPKLLYDEAPDTSSQEKIYNRAIDIANDPLSILSDAKKGMLEPQDVQHFNSMYPEVSNLVQQKLTQKMVKSAAENKRPPYHVRQSLSLLLGTPLSGELTPSYIQAAQRVFMAAQPQPQPQQQPPTKPKKSTAPLKNSSNQYMTPQQSRIAAESKS